MELIRYNLIIYRNRHTMLLINYIITILIVKTIVTATQQQVIIQKLNPNTTASPPLSIDELLRETLNLLDNLDQKINTVNNKSSNSMMRDNLRLLDDSLTPMDSSKQAREYSDDPSDFTNLDEAIIEESMFSDKRTRSEADDEDSNKLSKGVKKTRQLSSVTSHSQQSLASDSTERHIKFTLDLMQSIFTSQGYTAKNSNLIESFLISPVSIQMVLMLMHLGSRGATRREINQCLHLNTLDPENSLLPPIIATSSSDESDTIIASHSTTIPIQSGDSKLKRRQGSINPSYSSNVGNNAKSQILVARSQSKQPVVSTDAAHELFGAAMRNLLKDKNVASALTSVNKIFLQKNLPLSSQYDWAIKHYYATDIKQVDFQHQFQDLSHGNTLSTNSSNLNIQANSSNISHPESAKHNEDLQSSINEWVDRQTKGKITNFLTAPIPTSTLLMAINVIFFKGDWQFKFDPADTETDAWFYRANGETTKVPMMVSRLPLAFAHNTQMKTTVIELPYKSQRLGLFVLLPDDVSGIFHTMSMLNSTSFANLIGSMRKPAPGHDQTSSAINVRIPKFSIESSPRLTQILSQQMGLKTLFSPESADLSGMFEGKKSSNLSEPHNSIGVDELIHKAILQVDEHGSVAAATSATIVERVGVFNGNYFEADHPFLIFLIDKQTGLVLFSGAYGGPNQADGDHKDKVKKE